MMKNEIKNYVCINQEKDQQINSLNQQFYTTKNSISWAFFLKIQNSLNRVFPPNTRRGRFHHLNIFFLQSVKKYGLKYSLKKTIFVLKHPYLLSQNLTKNDFNLLKSWKELQKFDNTKIKNIKKEIKNFSKNPKISIIMPVYNVDKKWLRLAIESVLHQIYENWELCIVDDGSTKSHIQPILEEYSKKDIRIKVKFLNQNQGIAVASNEALSMVTGDYVGLLDHDDEIYMNALFEVIKAINNNSKLEIIYSDENHVDLDGNPIDPFFKPDFSPDLLLCCHYMVHFLVYKTTLLKK